MSPTEQHQALSELLTEMFRAGAVAAIDRLTALDVLKWSATRAGQRYAIGPASITCINCGFTSYHPEDVRNRYCSRCRVFHDEADLEALIQPTWHRYPSR